MNNIILEKLLNQKLNASSIKDYCPNGLQIEGKADIQRVVTGVTASQALIDQAIQLNADALLVHHGYFWKNESPNIIGMKGARIRALLKHDINLLAYHLPLDIHPELGNNVLLANALGITIEGGLEAHDQSVAMQGHFEQPLTAKQLSERIQKAFGRVPLHIDPLQITSNIDSITHAEPVIKTVGWCSGGGQDYIDLAAESQLDAFISGEISERTTHSAREQNIHYFSAGHHATECSGIKALGDWLVKEHGLDVTFVDIPNPV